MATNLGDYLVLAKREALVIGVDEAGRGPLAGPVVAAACVLGPDAPAGLDDSKQLSAKRRALLEPQIKASCRWALGVVQADEIDRINIFVATMLAMTRAVAGLVAELDAEPEQVLIDGNKTPHGRVPEWRWPARAIVGGD
ncbi:MAG: ribonuclease HII, partial [Novosphingobium sp.]|nr:ribonuclease HII [Novosphingobium sp.]